MKWIGLTGGIACGKSEVARLLSTLGIPIVHADLIAHKAFIKGSPTYLKVVEGFGSEILDSSGEIHRRRLGAAVFASEPLRLKLEAIVHPFVQSEVAKERQALIEQGQSWAVYEVPLLFEKSLQDNFHEIIVVGCQPNIQLKRLMSRNQLSEDEARLRIQSQWPLEEKRKGADYIIENNGSLEELSKQVIDLKTKIEASST